jgi:ABC-type dipeptide/oligopeptide/nickel transport system permease subunit
MFKHLLPNALISTVTFMPFILSGSVTTLTALDFLGFGLPPGSPSLGELLAQGKANLQAPWLGSPVSSWFPSCSHCWCSSARACAMRSFRERHLHERGFA